MKRLLAVLLFLMAGSLTIPVCFAATPAQVSGAEITGNGTTADISLTMTAQPRFHIFYLANPDRIVIDMEKIDWRAMAPVAQAGSLVSNLRHGMPAADQSRLVLDLASPARVTSARYAKDARSGKAQLLIAVRAVSTANFQQAAGAQTPAFQPSPGMTPSVAEAEAAASLQTAAGVPAAAKAAKPAATAVLQQARPLPALAQASPSWAQNQRAPVAAKAKQVYRQPLLTSADTAMVEEAQQSSQDTGLGYTSPDGVFVTYMHPPGSLVGGGVTIGTSF